MSYEVHKKEDICNEIIRIYNEHGKMNTKVFKKYNKLDITNSSVDYVFHKFGTLTSLCKELNIPFTRANKHNKQDIIEDVLRVYNEFGYLKSDLYDKEGKFSKTCIRSHFGGFNKMLEELDLPINMHKKITREDVKVNVLDFYKQYKTTSSNIYRKLGKYSECTITRLFGTWENLMEELNLPYLGTTYGYDEVMRQIDAVYKKYGFISKALIDEECDFTYQALSSYFKNKNEISKALGVEDAFCNTLSSKAKLINNILKILFGKENVETEKTWDWLRNPETNKMLPVDFYLNFLKIAIEYDGEQHSRFVKKFHKTEEDFYKACKRDEIKNQKLIEQGIQLIRIPYNAKITTKYINMLIISQLIKTN